MKFLSQCLLLQNFSELRDVSWQEISSLNRIFNFDSVWGYADKELPWHPCGKEALLKLQASSVAAPKEMFTCWAFAFGFLSFLPVLASCVVLEDIGEGLALALSFHGEPSEWLVSVVLSNSALQ